MPDDGQVFAGHHSGGVLVMVLMFGDLDAQGSALSYIDGKIYYSRQVEVNLQESRFKLKRVFSLCSHMWL
jgi:hypothetical protein